MSGLVARGQLQVVRQSAARLFIFLLRQERSAEPSLAGPALAFSETAARNCSSAPWVSCAQQGSRQGKLARVIIGGQGDGGAILLDGFWKFGSTLQGEAGKKSRAALGGLQFRRAAKRVGSRGRIVVHFQKPQIKVRGRHLRVQGDGPENSRFASSARFKPA